MAFCKTEGIVIRKVPFSETSQVVSFYTRDYGKVDALAKGARRLPKRGQSPLDLACRAQIVFIRKPRGLHALTEWEAVENFPGLRRGLSRLYGADYVVEFLRITTAESPNIELYAVALTTLRVLAETNNLPSCIFAFELHAVAALGYAPELQRCTRCGKAIGGAAVFSAARGGVVCQRCARNENGTTPVSAAARAALVHLLRTDIAHATRLRLNVATQAEVHRVIRRHIEYALNCRPRMWDYLTFRTKQAR